MLRIYCLQQWYNLSDPGAEEVLYDICSMRGKHARKAAETLLSSADRRVDHAARAAAG
jgi:IS5 family transposase